MEFAGRMWDCFSMVVVVVDEGEALASSLWHRGVCMHVPTSRMEVNDPPANAEGSRSECGSDSRRDSPAR